MTHSLIFLQKYNMSTVVVRSVEFDKCVVEPADCKLARFSLVFERVDHASFRFETDWFALGIQRGGHWKSSFKKPLRIPIGPMKDNPLPSEQESLKISLKCVVKEEESPSPSAAASSSATKESDTFVMQMGQAILTSSQLCSLLDGNPTSHSTGGQSTPSMSKVKLRGKGSYEYTVTLSSDTTHLSSHHSGSAMSDSSSPTSIPTSVVTDESLISSTDPSTTATPASTVAIAGGMTTSSGASSSSSFNPRSTVVGSEELSSSMEGYISLLKKELSDTKKRLSQTEDSLLGVSTKYGDLLTSLNGSRSSVKKKLASMCQMNDDLEGTMIQMKTSWNQTASILELSIEKQKSQIDSLTRERDSLLHSNDKYRSENREQQKVISDLRSEKVLNERRRVEVQMKLRQKENDCLKYHSKLKEYEVKISQLQAVLVKVLKGTIKDIELESDLGLAVMPAALESTDLPTSKKRSGDSTADLQFVRSEPHTSAASQSSGQSYSSKHHSSSSQGSADSMARRAHRGSVEADEEDAPELKKSRKSMKDLTKKTKTQSLPNGDSLSQLPT